MFHKAEKKINDLTDDVKEKFEDVTTTDTNDVKESIGKISDKGSSAASDFKEILTNKVESNPVGSTFAGAFIGLIIGIFISRK